MKAVFNKLMIKLQKHINVSIDYLGTTMYFRFVQVVQIPNGVKTKTTNDQKIKSKKCFFFKLIIFDIYRNKFFNNLFYFFTVTNKKNVYVHKNFIFSYPLYFLNFYPLDPFKTVN